MILRMNYPKLFRFKNQWQGVYLVVRDRLDNGLSQSDFLSFAKSAIPKDWPERLLLNENVIKNFSRGTERMMKKRRTTRWIITLLVFFVIPFGRYLKEHF